MKKQALGLIEGNMELVKRVQVGGGGGAGCGCRWVGMGVQLGGDGDAGWVCRVGVALATALLVFMSWMGSIPDCFPTHAV